MLMITKKLNQPFQLVFMNWKALENYQLYLDEVEIPTAEILNLEQINEKYQYLQELYLENFQSESWKNFINLKEDILSEIAKYKNVPTAVMKKVQNHFQEQISVQRLADHAGVDRSYLYTLFRRNLGMGPREYLTIFRLSRAADLLSYSGHSVEHIATACGYRDPLVFSKAFKTHYGKTPSAYRDN